MAKILLLSSILVAIAVAQAAVGPAQLFPATENLEARRAALAHLRIMETTFAKAKERGDEKKVADLILAFEIAAAMVIAAPPEKKLKVMVESFNSAVAPNPMDCPAVDKTYCEMHSKVGKAFGELEVRGEVLKNTMSIAFLTINKAYADGDDKKIAHVLAAYIKAADAVFAAAPAEKLKVMEKTFAAATASAARHPGAA
uniref:Pectinesterase inhibitor domain-containing protein n=1 Tax=Setaria viridis TaxID=4556 RepID=A0A4U6TK10_SETVI|nr:hypothetical protein SEVIR_7G036200v2 [Setaria viridis]